MFHESIATVVVLASMGSACASRSNQQADGARDIGAGGQPAESGSGGSGVGGATGTGGEWTSGGATGAGGQPGSGGAIGTGGVPGKGGATGTGGASGKGGTTGTTSVDASFEARSPRMGDPCESQSDCGPNPTALYCVAPGEPRGCGICLNPANPCTSDAECVPDGGSGGDTKICDAPPADLCFCRLVKICVAGCRSNSDCASGMACDTQHTCQKACVAGDTSCPVDYACGSSGICVRKACTSNAECSAACVKGACYSSRGTCQGTVA